MVHKYTDIRISGFIYVSSSGHYFTKVGYLKNHERETRDVWLDGIRVLGKRGDDIKIPRYVEQEIAQQLLECIESDKVVFFEYDGDGEQRRENLRYYTPEAVAHILKWLKEDYT